MGMTLFNFDIMYAKSSKTTWSWFVSKEFISEVGVIRLVIYIWKLKKIEFEVKFNESIMGWWFIYDD